MHSYSIRLGLLIPILRGNILYPITQEKDVSSLWILTLIPTFATFIKNEILLSQVQDPLVSEGGDDHTEIIVKVYLVTMIFKQHKCVMVKLK